MSEYGMPIYLDNVKVGFGWAAEDTLNITWDAGFLGVLRNVAQDGFLIAVRIEPILTPGYPKEIENEAVLDL